MSAGLTFALQALKKLFRHRTATPIDHPDRSITREKLEYPTENVELVYLTAIGKTKSYAAENEHHKSFVATVDWFTDKAIDAWCHSTTKSDAYYKIGVVGRIQDADNLYCAGLALARATADYGLVRITPAAIDPLGYEAVDLAEDSTHHIRLSIIGSTLKAYRGGVVKITATDTTFAAGGFGVKFATSSYYYTYDCGFVYATAKLLPPSSPHPPALAVLEIEREEGFKSRVVNITQSNIDLSKLPPHMQRDAKRYQILKQKGFTDEEIELIFGPLDIFIDTETVTRGAFEPRQEEPTIVVTVFGNNPYNDKALERQIEACRRKGLLVKRTAKNPLEKAKELWKEIKPEARNWIAGKDNFFYQVTGIEAFEIFAAIDFYYGILIEGVSKRLKQQIKRVPEWELRRIIKELEARCAAINVFKERRDKHLKRIKEIISRGW